MGVTCRRVQHVGGEVACFPGETPCHSPSLPFPSHNVVQPCSCNEVVRLQGSLPAERRTVCPGHALVHVPDTAQNRLEASALLFPQPEVIRATLLGG